MNPRDRSVSSDQTFAEMRELRRLAQYESRVVVSLRDGARIEGVFEAHDSDAISVRDDQGRSLVLPKREIRTITEIDEPL